MNDSAGDSRTKAWQRQDREHYLHPFTDHKALAERGTRVITRAEGPYIWDSEGNRILDGMAGLWCVNIGYGRNELADAAAEQLRKLPYYNSFFQTAHPPAIELASLLSEVTPEPLGHVFFTGSGSESNDTIVRMVRRYWELKGQPDKQVLISRVNAYHGSTMAAASLGGMKPMHAQGGLPIPGIVHIEQPYWYEHGGAMKPGEFGKKCATALEDKINELGVDQIAAFIAEPVQGAGGVIIPPASYWPEIQAICDRHEILLIADEVITGFGRTGEWFASSYFDIEPDLMPIAKGLSSGYLPIGGVMVADHVAATLIEEGGEFHHGFTYSGHPVACAVPLANVRLLRDEGIVERVRTETGPYFNDLWQALGRILWWAKRVASDFLGAIELVKDKSARTRFDPKGKVGTLCRDYCFDNHLIMRAVGDTMIVAPPLILDRGHIDELIDRVSTCLDLTRANLHRAGVDS